jgi:hypothetical protein
MLVCGCTTSTVEKNSIKILGKYTCTNDYITNGDSFTVNPDTIPSVTFNEDGSCEVVVNYLEGIATVYGTYSVDNKQVFVSLDLLDTTSEVYSIDENGKESVVIEKNLVVFQEGDTKHMDDRYVFDVIDNNNIVIDRGFYIVGEGDSFIKYHGQDGCQ